MSKLERWLTLVANLSVVAGIVFLAAEMRQNTAAIQAQTRDSVTEKQMTFAGWIGTNPQVAAVYARGNAEGIDAFTDPGERTQYILLAGGLIREWENSHYQNQRGLFASDEFEARSMRWRRAMAGQGFRDYWVLNSEAFAPSFRAEIDRIVAEVEQAQ